MENIACSFFNWYKPCKFQKTDKSLVCSAQCKFQKHSTWKILIIKRGAIGEVLRCTTLIPKLKEHFPSHEIWWLTDYPTILDGNMLGKIIPFSLENIYLLEKVEFDLAINLDKENICSELINRVNAKTKKWYHLKDMKILPIDQDAYYLWKRWIDDVFMKQDARHYLDEIFEVCGFKFNEEKYLIPPYKVPDLNSQLSTSKKVIWLNTWTSGTWKTRLWENRNWITLSKQLLSSGYEVVLLWWNQEHERNQEISAASGAKYFGTFDFSWFIWLVSLVDVLITQVTFAMHVGVWLEKKTVLLNNIFNKHEYYFYSIPHKVLEPNVWCKMCYKSNFDSSCEVANCMELITVEAVYNSIQELLNN